MDCFDFIKPQTFNWKKRTPILIALKNIEDTSRLKIKCPLSFDTHIQGLLQRGLGKDFHKLIAPGSLLQMQTCHGIELT